MPARSSQSPQHHRGTAQDYTKFQSGKVQTTAKPIRKDGGPENKHASQLHDERKRG